MTDPTGTPPVDQPPADPTDPTPPANPPTDPAPPTDPTPPADPAQGTDWKAEARKWENRAKDNNKATQAEQAKLAGVLAALGLKADGTEDVKPEEITARLEQANSKAWTRGVHLQLHQLAPKHGADATALLDSMTFVNSLDDLTDVDPDDADFTAQLDKRIQAAIAANPKLKADPGPTPPKRSGPDGMTGGQGAPARSGSLFAAVQAATRQT
ncbi:hypothetical protein [Saccharothrix sp. HUAS TT1]|uniref:hypothetical protein n=1 Tax=unclassified Saccharothrix TaxID=2593673 RepID=UPI00345C4162